MDKMGQEKEGFQSLHKDEEEKVELRPWGRFKILHTCQRYKVKEITVKPGKRLSKQRHKFRDEHWYFISGKGIVTLGDSMVHKASANKEINIPKLAAHRVENTGKSNLVFIEIQTGSYFGEDDIERLEDDFGRV